MDVVGLRVLVHLGEDVADDAALLVLGDVGQLRPGEDVVEVSAVSGLPASPTYSILARSSRADGNQQERSRPHAQVREVALRHSREVRDLCLPDLHRGSADVDVAQRPAAAVSAQGRGRRRRPSARRRTRQSRSANRWGPQRLCRSDAHEHSTRRVQLANRELRPLSPLEPSAPVGALGASHDPSESPRWRTTGDASSSASASGCWSVRRRPVPSLMVQDGVWAALTAAA